MIVWDAMTDSATLEREIWEWDGDRFRRESYGDALADARRASAALRARGYGPGSIVPAVLTNGSAPTRGAMGVMFAGATLASLPIIARGMSVTAYVSQLRDLCEHLSADCLLLDERFLGFIPEDADLGVELIGYHSLLRGEAMADLTPPPLDNVLFIQFSSGTTRQPRGAELTGHAVEAQLTRLADSLDIDSAHDVGYMWLPLSHDMGIVGGALLAWYTGMRAVKSTPERFLQSPRSWFDDCARFGATVTAGPPSALEMAARAERAGSSRTPLRVRLCLLGAELVDWSVLERAVRTFGPRGLGMGSLTTGYGLAEATLAVTVGDLDAAPEFVDVDADALALGTVHELEASERRSRRVVSAGRAIMDTTVSIDPATGEILIESPSLASGYFANDEATREHFEGRSFRTSDLGFIHAGQLFVAGRSDEVVIVHGRNVFVHELEARLGAEPAIRDGSCAVVQDVEGGRRHISLVAEVGKPHTGLDELTARLRKIAMDAEGLPIDELVFLPPGMFPATPSGKVQRYRCREIVRRHRSTRQCPMRPDPRARRPR
jgi:fatty-acyl-CoA synthase